MSSIDEKKEFEDWSLLGKRKKSESPYNIALMEVMVHCLGKLSDFYTKKPSEQEETLRKYANHFGFKSLPLHQNLGTRIKKQGISSSSGGHSSSSSKKIKRPISGMSSTKKESSKRGHSRPVVKKEGEGGSSNRLDDWMSKQRGSGDTGREQMKTRRSDEGGSSRRSDEGSRGDRGGDNRGDSRDSRDSNTNSTSASGVLPNSHVDGKLLTWFKEARANKTPVSMRMLKEKAKDFSANPKFKASRLWLDKFMERHKIKKKPTANPNAKFIPAIEKYLQDIKDLKSANTFLVCVNLDELSFHFNASGEETKETPVSGADPEKFTVFIGITSKGEMLTPWIIFQYSPESEEAGHAKFDPITKELEGKVVIKYNQSGSTTVELLEEWVNCTLKPMENIGKGCVILDAASQHKDPSLHTTLKEVGAKHIIIPKGCATYLQPIDLKVNKGLKEFVRIKFEDWLKERSEQGLDNTQAPPDTAKLVDWVIQACNSIPLKDIERAFKATGTYIYIYIYIIIYRWDNRFYRTWIRCYK